MGLEKRHHIQCALKTFHRKNDTADIHHIGNLLYTRFKEDHARFLDQPIQIIPGFPEVYAHLKDKQIPIGVTTGYAYQETLQIMQQFRKRGYLFDSVVPSTDKYVIVDEARASKIKKTKKSKFLGIW